VLATRRTAARRPGFARPPFRSALDGLAFWSSLPRVAAQLRGWQPDAVVARRPTTGLRRWSVAFLEATKVLVEVRGDWRFRTCQR
jgi:hypothetical protein